MNTYIALIRGINVGGKKIILMADLKKSFENAGFSNVSTYIQSGNVVFKSVETETLGLETKLENVIKDFFGFDVKVVVKEYRHLVSIFERNPYRSVDIKNTEKVYFTLLSQTPAVEKIAMLENMKSDSDIFSLADQTFYLLCRTGYNITRFNNNYLEKILKVKATTRNEDTIRKLLEIAKNL